jgi:MFS family permease
MLARPSNDKLPPKEASPDYKWWVLLMLWFVCFFNYTDRQAISSVFPKLKAEFGFDKVQLGFIGSAFMYVYAFGSPVAGYLGDRLRRKDLILGGCLFWSAVTALTGWCSKLWQFIVVRALTGLGETFYFPSATSLLSDYHGGKTRSRALGIHNSGVYVGTIAGGWLGAWFAEHLGWRIGFYFFGAAGILLALVLYRGVREPTRGASDAATFNPEGTSAAKPLSVKEIGGVLLRKPTALLLLGAFMAANFVAAIFLVWTPTFLVEKFHFQLTMAGFSGSVFINVASALSVPFGGWLADHLAARMASGRILVQGFGLLVGSVFVFGVGSATSAGLLLVTMSLFGLCKGIYDSNIFAAIFDVVESRARGTAAGLMNTVGWGGGALGPVIVGWLSQHGRHATEMENMSEAISLCSGIYVAGALLLFAAAMRAKKDILRPAQSTLKQIDAIQS